MELKIIRIELLDGADDETYNKLHQFMENNGFLRYIYPNDPSTANTTKYPLPTATYCADSIHRTPDLAQWMLDNIKANIWYNPRVLVMGVGTNWAIRGN